MSFHEDQERLNRIDLLLRQRLDLAELYVPKFNDLIRRLATLGVWNDVVLLGDIIVQRPYSPGMGPIDSGQLLQAALLVPGGIGAAVWDTEEWLELRQTQFGLEREARLHFRSFDSLALGEKSPLIQSFGPLMKEFSTLLSGIE